MIKSFEEYYNEDNLLFLNPTILDNLKEHNNEYTKLEEQAIYYLPYNTGIEIECDVQPNWSSSLYNELDLVANASSTFEQRIQIYPGLRGAVTLYKYLEILQQYGIHTTSGIHIHIDVSKFIKYVYDDGKFALVASESKSLGEYFQKHSEFILKELDTWGYKGTYNRREVRVHKGGWFGYRSEKNSVEIRICEMTFDYRVLIRRIVHCQYIVKYLYAIQMKDRFEDYKKYIAKINNQKLNIHEIPILIKKRENSLYI